MSVSHDEQQSGHGSTREPEDFLAEILERLRDEGVQPLSDGELADLGRVLLEQGAGRLVGNRPARLTADLIEARAKLAEARARLDDLATKAAACGWWLEYQSPFRPGVDPHRAGLTPAGTTGWNGRPDVAVEASTAQAVLDALAIELERRKPGDLVSDRISG